MTASRHTKKNLLRFRFSGESPQQRFHKFARYAGLAWELKFLFHYSEFAIEDFRQTPKHVIAVGFYFSSSFSLSNQLPKPVIYMRNLFNIGRIFYGVAIAALGFQTIYYYELPYMLLPWDLHGPAIIYITGIIFLLCGACIVFDKKTEEISLLFGGILLLVFLFCFVPYQFFVSKNHLSLGDWENAEKELALSAGAFVMANSFAAQNKNGLIRFLRKPATFGTPVFAIIIFGFGILHFVYAKQASPLVPSWIPNHLFWIYFAGVALLGSGIAIVLKIKTRLIATLLGTMIFTWFVILHIPRIIAAPAADMPGEVASALIALAYSGTAFAIAGSARNEIKEISA